MRRSLLLTVSLGILVSASLISGCSKKNDSAAVDSARNESVKSEAENVAPASAPQTAGKLNGPVIKSSSFDNFLPSINGYTAEKPNHIDMNMNGMIWSGIERNYSKENGHIKVTIFDYNYNQQLAQPFEMMRNMSIETDKEVSKSETFNGFPGWYSWNKESNDGKAMAFLNDRIFVIIEGNDCKVDDLKDILNKMDLSGIAKLAS